MSKFDRYVLARLMAAFGFFGLILIGTYWVNRALGIFDQLVADGQSVFVFLELVSLFLPQVMAFMLPVAALAATVYVINRLRSDSELVVVLAAGVTPWRVMRPVLYFGLLTAFLAVVLANFLVPASRTLLADRQAEIRQDITARMVVEGQFISPGAGVTFFVRRLDEKGELRDVFLYDTRTEGRDQTYTAKRAILLKDTAGPKLLMFDGTLQTVELSTGLLSLVGFSDLSFDLSPILAHQSGRNRGVRDFSTLQALFPTQAMLDETGARAEDFAFEAHDRLVQPLHPLVYSFVAAAIMMLGSFSRFGSIMQMTLSIVLVLAINILGSVAADTARSHPELWPLIYAPNILVFALALLVLPRTGRPLWSRHRAIPATQVPT